MLYSKFKRKIENFKCAVCGTLVEGNGYTDHCPNCLWSKHIDINPGDRTNSCHGLMEPIGLEKKKGEFKIQYRCQKCGERKLNVVSKEDKLEKSSIL